MFSFSRGLMKGRQFTVPALAAAMSYQVPGLQVWYPRESNNRSWSPEIIVASAIQNHIASGAGRLGLGLQLIFAFITWKIRVSLFLSISASASILDFCAGEVGNLIDILVVWCLFDGVVLNGFVSVFSLQDLFRVFSARNNMKGRGRGPELQYIASSMTPWGN